MKITEEKREKKKKGKWKRKEKPKEKKTGCRKVLQNRCGGNPEWASSYRASACVLPLRARGIGSAGLCIYLSFPLFCFFYSIK